MSADVLERVIAQGMELDRGQAVFGWQGGEPTLCGLPFFQRVVALQQKHGASGQAVSNGLQTNALLLDAEWARFLRQYEFLLGVSLDGPEALHDHYRRYAAGGATHARVREALRLLSANEVEFNILSVVNDVTGDHAEEIYDYFVGDGFAYLQFIPCVERDPHTGLPTPFSVRPRQFGDFLCALFDRWYHDGEPEVSIRDFDAILAVYLGQEAPLCSYQERCGSYLVVEYNGDLYPCDFCVRAEHLIGNVQSISLQEAFAATQVRALGDGKARPRTECQVCAWRQICHQGCPRMLNLAGDGRHYLCRAYQQFFHHSRPGFEDLARRALERQGLSTTEMRTPVVAVGRNDPCPCGSGKKHKQCCGRGSR
jgi:uncharacterized protein